MQVIEKDYRLVVIPVERKTGFILHPSGRITEHRRGAIPPSCKSVVFELHCGETLDIITHSEIEESRMAVHRILTGEIKDGDIVDVLEG